MTAPDRLITLLLLVLLFDWRQVPIRETPMPSGTASIAGVVVDSDGMARSVRQVRVTLRSTDGVVGLSTTSDDSGRFVIRNVPARRYVLEATKAAWLTTAYGASRPGRPGTPIAVAEGDRITGMILKISRGAVVTGTVTDLMGQPAVGVRVQALRFVTQNGERVLDAVTGGGVALTDDMGAYRIYGLPSGEVVVGVLQVPTSVVSASDPSDFTVITPADMRRAAQLLAQSGRVAPNLPGLGATSAQVPKSSIKLASVFYPSVTDVNMATLLNLTAGEERSSIDITLQAVPTAHVTGVVTGLDGAPLTRGVVVAAGNGGMTVLGIGAGGFVTSPITERGEYQLGGLTPGSYTLLAGGAVGWAKAEIGVSGQDQNVLLQLQPGLSLRGRVIVEGATATQQIDRLRVNLDAIGPLSRFIGRATGAPVQNGVFKIDELVPSSYRVRLDGVPDGWFVRSGVAGGRDVLDGTLEIRPQDRVTEMLFTLTNRPGELSGSLRDAAGRPAPDYFIIVFSSDPKYWTTYSRRILPTRPANDGSFALKGMPAGDYFIAALTDVEPDEWLSPAFLQSLIGAAVKVTIVEGQKTLQDLEIRKFQLP